MTWLRNQSPRGVLGAKTAANRSAPRCPRVRGRISWVRIARVRHRCALVLAVLIYVTLDLSLPGMPGAFVFAPADSVEGTQVRARGGAEAVAPLALARDTGLVPLRPPLDSKERLAPASSAGRRVQPVGSWQSQALYESSPPSEDPH